MKFVENSNPRDDSGTTPLHEAANEGHFNMCQFIMMFTREKNPGDEIELKQ